MLVVEHELAVLLHADLVVDLVDVLVDAAALPQHLGLVLQKGPSEGS